MKKKKGIVIQQKMDRRNSIIDIKTISAGGGAIVSFDKDGQPQVLLIYRRGVWDLPKGKKEETESLPECAIREVKEEIGILEDPVMVVDLTQTYHEYRQGDIHFEKDTYWYGMKLSSNEVVFKPETKEGIEKVEWVPLPEASRRVGYDNLTKVLRSVKDKLSSFRKH